MLLFLQIIKIDFLHFDLGPQSYDPCSSSNDRLIFSDISRDQETVTCGGSDLKQYVSKTNNVTVTFISNANHDAKGFRAFYEAGKHILKSLFKIYRVEKVMRDSGGNRSKHDKNLLLVTDWNSNFGGKRSLY